MNQEEHLLSVLDYYSVDLNRRCVRRDSNGDIIECCYSPKTAHKEGVSLGCAIGKDLHPEVQEHFDETYGNTIRKILSKPGKRALVPMWMLQLGELYLVKVQNLHDTDVMWDLKKGEGLSQQGILKVSYIIREHQMDSEKFSKYLKS